MGAPIIMVSTSELSRSPGSALGSSAPPQPQFPAPMTRLKLTITAPTYKGFKFTDVEDVPEESGSDDDDGDDFQMLSARFRTHQGASVPSFFFNYIVLFMFF